MQCTPQSELVHFYSPTQTGLASKTLGWRLGCLGATFSWAVAILPPTVMGVIEQWPWCCDPTDL